MSPIHVLEQPNTDLQRRFSTNRALLAVNPRERGRAFAEESRSLLSLRDVSLTTVQACILLGSISQTDGEAAAESMYYSVACRTAKILDLANRPTSNKIEREVNLRGEFSYTCI